MFKNKKVWVGISLAVILIIILIVLGIQYSKPKLVTENHLAYLSVNSIILKIDYTENYEQNKKGKIVGEIKTEINEIEYLTDEAKDHLADLEFKNKSMEETINNIIDILKEKKLDYQNIYFYTDSKNSDVNISDTNIVLNKKYQEHLDEEEVLKSTLKVMYRVSFDSNGGSPIASIYVEEGSSITKPDNPTRDGYTFTCWMLDDKEYDFTTTVTADIVLKATWNKSEAVNSNTNDKTNSSSNNSSNNKTISSTIDKINLNDFISVAINYYRYSTPYAYMYPINLSELEPKVGNKTNLVVVDDDTIDPYGNKVSEYDFVWSEWNKSILPSLKYDTAKEKKVESGLNNLVNKKTKGVKLTVSTNNHQYYYQYKYLTIDNKDFSSINSAFTTLRNNLNKELNNVTSGGVYIDFLNSYGVYPKYYKTLDEELCSEYNLVCDRW